MEVGAGRPPDPLRRRADACRRPGARRRFPARRRPFAGLAVLELRSPEGAFERIEAYLREHGFFAPRRRGARSRPLPRLRALGAAPPHPAPAPARAVPPAPRGRVLSAHDGVCPRTVPHGQCLIGEWERSWSDAEYAAAVEAVRAAIGRGDVYQVNLVQHLSAPFSRRSGCAGSAACGRSGRARMAGDGWAIVSASPELFLARRGRRVWTCPIKGTRPLGEHVEGREGLGRARDDRRPRAERPLPGLRARLGPLAGADGRARAGGRHTSRLDGRGNAREAALAWPSSSQRRSPAAP